VHRGERQHDHAGGGSVPNLARDPEHHEDEQPGEDHLGQEGAPALMWISDALP
jgi:hypothetical protein